MEKTFGGLFLLAVILILSICGARLGHLTPVIAMISLIGIVAVLVSIGKWPEKLFIPTIYTIGLSLVFLTTLHSNYLIGSDNHIELYFAQLTMDNGWDRSLHFNMNSALSITLFVPFISKLFFIEPTWVFKAVLPLFYALVPVILYLIFGKFMAKKEAFLASFFFVIVPVFFIEVAAIGRQQMAEIFFVCFLGLLVIGVERLKLTKKAWFVFIVLSGFLTIVSHYTVGGILMLYGILAAAFILVLRMFRAKLATPSLLSTAAIAAVFVFGLVYYGMVSGGTALHDFLRLVPIEQLHNLPFLNHEAAPHLIPPWASTGQPAGDAAAGLAAATSPVEPLMQMALGLDFLSMPISAQLFRVFQYITQILLVIGAGYFILKWRRMNYTWEYLAVVAISGVLLLLCIVKPGFSSMLNASRFYHIALMVTAPFIIYGAKVVFRISKPVWAPQCVLVALVFVPYLFFASGIAFEAAKIPDVKRFYMPYSYALSDYRLDLWGNYTEDDEIARQMIASCQPEVIYTDVFGRVFLQETIGYTIPIYFLPKDLSEVPDNAFVFLRSHNNESQTIAYWAGAGMREYATYQDLNMGNLLGERPILFQSGHSMVLGVEG